MCNKARLDRNHNASLEHYTCVSCQFKTSAIQHLKGGVQTFSLACSEFILLASQQSQARYPRGNRPSRPQTPPLRLLLPGIFTSFLKQCHHRQPCVGQPGHLSTRQAAPDQCSDRLSPGKLLRKELSECADKENVAYIQNRILFSHERRNSCYL